MKTKGMGHQITGLNRVEGKRNFAFLMEQGTGKTWLTLADAERCYLSNKIDAVLVFAPRGVHTNWVRREIPTHLEVPVLSYAWQGRPTTKKAKAGYEALYQHFGSNKRPPLIVLTMNFEAANTPAGYEAAELFIDRFRTMVVIDESTRIKNPSAKRTKKIIKLGRNGIARRILSGTPLTKAPTDLFSQFDFLKPGLLGTTSYRAFMAEYSVLLKEDDPKMKAIMRKLAGKVSGMPQVVAEDEDGNKMWRNLDKLSDLILPHSYRVTKEECLDLPPKVYKVAYFDLTPKQRSVYQLLVEDYAYKQRVHVESMGDDDGLEYKERVSIFERSFEAIAARTKMKQVTSGYINIDGSPILMEDNENPRLDLFKELIEGVEGQFIVWAMFQEEIRSVVKALNEAGISTVEYHGGVNKEDREWAIDNFQAGKVRAFVGHAAAAGIGLTLTAAHTAIYYSCSFDNELRMQSEDRCHRIGTVNKVTYFDLVGIDTIDEDVQRSLATKSALASYIIDRDRKAPVVHS